MKQETDFEKGMLSRLHKLDESRFGKIAKYLSWGVLALALSFATFVLPPAF